MICSKFITFAVTKTTDTDKIGSIIRLWFAQNSLPLRWQRQLCRKVCRKTGCCDLLKIHYLCGDKDNFCCWAMSSSCVVICSKFITFAVTKTTLFVKLIHIYALWFAQNSLPLRWQRQRCVFYSLSGMRCDLLKIHYLCGDKDNTMTKYQIHLALWFAQNSLPLRWQRQHHCVSPLTTCGCDLLKIHYLCGDKDNEDED